MYRCSVDNAVTYTSEDFVLFRESPFACWMERLTLENPNHAIPPDVGSAEPQNTMQRQDDIVDTLRAEDRDVTLIDWDLPESRRRSNTLEAMRAGVDFIVNGQLALGPLSGSANLLMRTSGYSDLGSYLYIPCDTQAKTTLHSAFRLCFLADLLHSLQGQLPPQMLIIRGGSDVLPLQCEDHIYHYRAVKQRFMDSMRTFRKHRMPDPAESSHFGRWSDCAHEVLKQRALKAEQQNTPEPYEDHADQRDEEFEIPMLQAASAGYHGDVSVQVEHAAPQSDVAAPSQTLAEQAGMLDPKSYSAGLAVPRQGSTPNLARAQAAMVDSPSVPDRRHANTTQPTHNRRSADVALENLEFIGSSHREPQIGGVSLDRLAPAIPTVDVAHSAAPTPALDACDDMPIPAVDEHSEAGLNEGWEPPEIPAVHDAPPPELNRHWEQRSAIAGQQQSFVSEPPGPGLGEPPTPVLDWSDADPQLETTIETAEPQAMERSVVEEQGVTERPPLPAGNAEQIKPHPLDSVGFNTTAQSVVDRDADPAPPPKPASLATGAGFELDIIDDSDYIAAELPAEDFIRNPQDQEPHSLEPFSNSLQTSDEYDDT
ncbi:MAG: hypothetical protein V7700_09770 [Halioglobus sp.]